MDEKNKKNDLNKKEELKLKRIKEVFEESGMSQRKFAALLDIEPPSFNKILVGTNNLSKLLANTVELKLGISAKWLLEGVEPKKINPTKKLDVFDRMILELLDGPQTDDDQKGILHVIYILAKRAGERIALTTIENQKLTGERPLKMEVPLPTRYEHLNSDRGALFNKALQKLTRDEFLWMYLTLHHRDEGEAGRTCQKLIDSGYDFPKQIPEKIKKFIDDLNEVQNEIDTILELER